MQKGGVGKSTLARSLAVAAVMGVTMVTITGGKFSFLPAI